MTYNFTDLNKSGIYCIRNRVNGKVYIGKSINIHKRMIAHVSALNKKNIKNENTYFINSWHKYGKENFEYFVLEYLGQDEELLQQRELHWMSVFRSTDREFGYNLRQDSSTNMLVHETTRKRCSEAQKKRQADNPHLKEEVSKFFKDFWMNNPDKKAAMGQKSRENATKYYIDQYDKVTGLLVKRWDFVKDIITANPTYKQHNIYSACSGAKPSIYGYVWKKVLKS